MPNRRKHLGQGSTEYLVILGAVLLISIVVVNAVSAVPSSQSSIKSQQSQAYWSSLSPIKVLSSKVVDNNLVLQLQNTGASTIRLDGIAVGNTNLPIYPYYSGDAYGPAYCSRPNDNFSAMMTCALMLAPSESVYVAAQGAISGTGNVVDCAGKASVELSDVRLIYSTSGSGLNNLMLKGDKPIIASCGSKACDQYWVKVPGNSSRLVNDFCLMKYEAKLVDGVVASMPSGAPSESLNQRAASDACGALGSGYHLIRDREWMAMAFNVASNPRNWINGTVGSGCLYAGHMECNTDPNRAHFEASANDDAGYWNGTMNYTSGAFNCPFKTNCDRGVETRRTFYLSTGEALWDVSGNAWEWTDATIFENRTSTSACTLSSTCKDDPEGITGEMPTSSNSNVTRGWNEYPAMVDYKGSGYLRLPNAAWNTSNGMGNIQTSPGLAYNNTAAAYASTTHAIVRGGVFGGGDHAYAGLFVLLNEYSTEYSFGFRCAR